MKKLLLLLSVLGVACTNAAGLNLVVPGKSTNVSARLNLFYGRKLKGVRIVHDQQLEVEDILCLGKATAEAQREADSIPYTPHSDFVFAETASFEFAQSHEATGIQLADVVAGTVMRYFRDSPRTVIDPDLDRVMRMLIGESNGLTGYGINQVVPWVLPRFHGQLS